MGVIFGSPTKAILRHELFQKRITKWIIFSGSYCDRLKRMGILLLSLHLQLQDLLFLNKLLNNSYDLDISIFLNITVNDGRYSFRGSTKQTFVARKTKKASTDAFYFNGIIPLANQISSTGGVNLFENPNEVKRKLKDYMWDYFINSYNENDCRRFVKCYCC